jgi:hypothetical protein
VQDRAVLGRVDVLAREHLVAHGLDTRLADEREQLGEDGARDELLGVVEQERRARVARRGILGAERGEALRVLREQVLEHELAVLAVVDRLQLLPRRVVCVDRAQRGVQRTPI